jgi:hypothetical protein
VEHGLASLDESGKVEDAVEGFPLGFGGGENFFKNWPVCQLSLYKFHAGWHKVAPAMAQVVKNHNLMAIFGQQSSDCSTNVPGAACYQYLHKKLSLPKRFGIA